MKRLKLAAQDGFLGLGIIGVIVVVVLVIVLFATCGDGK